MPDIAILGNMRRGQEYYVFTRTKSMPVRVQTSEFKAKEGKEKIVRKISSPLVSSKKNTFLLIFSEKISYLDVVFSILSLHRTEML